MIKMTKGTYGLRVGGVVEAMTPHSPPFKLPEAREAELVAAGVAVKVEEPAKASPWDGMKMVELRKAAAAMGVDVSAAKSKKDVVELLEAVGMPKAYHEDEKQYSGLLEED